MTLVKNKRSPNLKLIQDLYSLMLPVYFEKFKRKRNTFVHEGIGTFWNSYNLYYLSGHVQFAARNSAWAMSASMGGTNKLDGHSNLKAITKMLLSIRPLPGQKRRIDDEFMENTKK